MMSLLFHQGCTNPTDSTPEPISGQEITLNNWQLEKVETATARLTELINRMRFFLSDPDEENRLVWQAAWYEAHEAWLAAAYLLPETAPLRSRIDSWPIEPGFLDDLPEYPHSGLINELMLDINNETLKQQHQITDANEVALGLHVIEYYAFGRNLDSFQAAAPQSQRRKALLNTVADQLLLDYLEYGRSLKIGEPAYPLPATQLDLLLTLHHHSEQLFKEMNRLGTHGGFSDSSIRNIAAQLDTTSELMRGSANLMPFLTGLEPSLTESLHQTLTESSAIMDGKPQLEEWEASRVLLLLSAVSQQLEDLILAAQPLAATP